MSLVLDRETDAAVAQLERAGGVSKRTAVDIPPSTNGASAAAVDWERVACGGDWTLPPEHWHVYAPAKDEEAEAPFNEAVIWASEDPDRVFRELRKLPPNSPMGPYVEHLMDLVARQDPITQNQFVIRISAALPGAPRGVLRTMLRERSGRVAPDDGPNLTDMGNAQRFARDHAGYVRYCASMRTWFAWEGLRWVEGADELVMQRAKDTVRKILLEAAAERSDDRRRALTAWALESESAGRLHAMVSVARSEADLLIEADEFDANPWLLNCPNGVLDLRTGRLRPQTPEDLMTRMTAAPYLPGAQHPMWTETFLPRVFPDAALCQYAQRWAGYCLTGDYSEDAFAFAAGETKGGKTTFVVALSKTLGDYARHADISTFAAGRPKGGSPREDVFRLRARRLVVSSEVPKGMRLDVAHIKQWTGGDPIVARTLYRGSAEFPPTFKIVIACNDLPEAPDNDDAFWERVGVLPFPPTIPLAERKREVKTTLTDPAQAGAAILAWMVEGCLAWQRQGLGTRPEAVERATRAYRTAMNPIATFVEDHWVLRADLWTASDTLWQAYVTWVRTRGALVDQPELTRQKFGQALARLPGVTATAGTRARGRGYQGIGIPEAES